MTTCIGSYTSTVRTSAGKPLRDTGKYLLVFHHQIAGSWKVAVEMFSSDLPPADRA